MPRTAWHEPLQEAEGVRASNGYSVLTSSRGELRAAANRADSTSTLKGPGLILARLIMYLRLATYFGMHGVLAAWPAEVSSLMGTAANLSEEGVRKRNEHMVANYNLALWTVLATENMLSEAKLLKRSEDSVHEMLRHFGVPAVEGTKFGEMRKPQGKKAWKPHFTPQGVGSMYRQGSQQSPRGNSRQSRRGSVVGRQSRRQSEVSPGGYTSFPGGRTPSVTLLNRPAKVVRKDSSSARSTGTHGGAAPAVNQPMPPVVLTMPAAAQHPPTLY